ncbi:hypothetical protein LIA77_06634 [Sarocladium implicatum]|nr:hypothetical protein LIA77_06634 [Sarocladium implicatum]
MLAQLSLILTYTLEPSLGRFYHDWFLAPDSIFQQIIFPFIQLLNAKVPYSLFFSYLYHALSLPFLHLRNELLESPFGQLFQSFPRVVAAISFVAQCIWLTVSTPVSWAIWGIQYYFDHVTDPNLRFLFVAFLALGAYGLLVLGLWYWVVWYTIDFNMGLLRFSLKLAEKILQRLVRMMESLLGSLRTAIKHVRAALFALLAMSHWFARILSLLILVIVDRFVDAIDHTNKLQAQGDVSSSHSFLPTTLGARIARKVAVYAYICYVTRQSIVTVVRWLLSLQRVHWTFAFLRQLLIWLFSLAHKLVSPVAALIRPDVNAVLPRLKAWVDSFPSGRLVIKFGVMTQGFMMDVYQALLLTRDDFQQAAVVTYETNPIIRLLLAPVVWILSYAIKKVNWGSTRKTSPPRKCPCFEQSHNCSDCPCHDHSCKCKCHGDQCGCDCHELSCNCHCRVPPPEPNPRFLYSQRTTTIPGTFVTPKKVNRQPFVAEEPLRRSPRLQSRVLREGMTRYFL